MTLFVATSAVVVTCDAPGCDASVPTRDYARAGFMRVFQRAGQMGGPTDHGDGRGFVQRELPAIDVDVCNNHIWSCTNWCEGGPSYSRDADGYSDTRYGLIR